MKYILLATAFLFAVIPSQSFAFKWSKCKQEYKHTAAAVSKSRNLGSMLMNYLADFTSQATIHSSTSTTSFVSSTGNCAAFAKADNERKMFIADSLTEIKMESAEGRGEHLSSLAALYGCENDSKNNFVQMLRSKHSEIFSDEEQQNPAELNDRILDSLMHVKELRNRCNIDRT